MSHTGLYRQKKNKKKKENNGYELDEKRYSIKRGHNIADCLADSDLNQGFLFNLKFKRMKKRKKEKVYEQNE